MTQADAWPFPTGHPVELMKRDVLSTFLDRIQMSAIVPMLSEHSAPWGVRAPTGSGGFFSPIEGSMFLRLETEEAVELHAGDVAMLSKGQYHTVSDSPATPARPIQDVLTPQAFMKREGLFIGGGGAKTQVACGVFRFRGEESVVFPSALPGMIVVRAATPRGRVLSQVVRLMVQMAPDQSEGSLAVLSRLAGVVFVEMVREFVSTMEVCESGMIRAMFDEHLGPVLGLMHAEPGRDWSLAILANEAGFSRTVFHERFTEVMGVSPMRYLRDCRMRRSADLLTASNHDLRQIAEMVGYASDGAFSAAFKSWKGVSPGEYRVAKRAVGANAAPPRSTVNGDVRAQAC